MELVFFPGKGRARKRDAIFDTFVPNAEQPGMIFVILLPEYRVYSLYLFASFVKKILHAIFNVARVPYILFILISFHKYFNIFNPKNREIMQNQTQIQKRFFPNVDVPSNEVTCSSS